MQVCYHPLPLNPPHFLKRNYAQNVQLCTYPNALPAVPLSVLGANEEFFPEPGQDVVEGLGTGNDVEGGGEGATLVKVADPQLGAGKLPLLICLALKAWQNMIEQMTKC